VGVVSLHEKVPRGLLKKDVTRERGSMIFQREERRKSRKTKDKMWDVDVVEEG
jgi:hypothetical protein